MKLSLVIPTYNERENIRGLIFEVLWEFKTNKIDGEIIVVDDNSPDGTGELLDEIRRKNRKVRVIHRERKMGLSSAVLEGWKIAKGDVLGVMDADLSHPPNKIKDLLWSIEKGKADFAIGSRYVRGGKIMGRSAGRNAMSKLANLVARVFTNVKDPMTGFFMIRKSCIKDVELDPKGFKILLEIIIKGKHKNIQEIPITFVDRVEGRSKVSISEIFSYVRNLIGYASYQKLFSRDFMMFSFAGIVGTILNLSILYFMTEVFGIYYLISAVFSFSVAMTSNFFMNKILTFREKMTLNIGRKYLQFVSVSLVALLVNLTFLFIFTDIFGIYYLISQAMAIVITALINFFGNKIWTFSK